MLEQIQFFEVKESRITKRPKKVSLSNVFTRQYIEEKMMEKKQKLIRDKAEMINQKLQTAPNPETVFLEKVTKIREYSRVIDAKLKTG